MIIVNNTDEDKENKKHHIDEEDDDEEELEKDLDDEDDDDEEELEEDLDDEDDDDEDETRMDMEIEKNIKSFLNYGTTIEILTIIATCIAAFGCFAEEEPGIGFIMLFCGIISALIVSMAIKWFGYTLHCLYEIKNNTNK